jgi:iron(III) transport system substrate-binding protein
MTRREMIQWLGITGVTALTVACGQGPSTQSPSVSSAPTGNEPWAAEWNQLVTAAKQEANLAIQTPAGTGFRNWLEAFRTAFPGIAIEHTALRGSDFATRAKAEREAGILNMDVAISSPGSVGRILRPMGYFDPLKDAIFRNDIFEDQYWQGGYASHYLDNEGKYYFGFGADIYPILFINTKQVQEGEIKSFKDLLNPKWKGKILQKDPRTEGAGYISMSVLRVNMGPEADELIKRFYAEMAPDFGTDDRQNTEFMVRGRYAISYGGINEDMLADFQAEGVGQEVKLLVLPELTAIDPGDCLWRVSKPPHPNAAKLFLNWSLTKEGQTLWSKELQANSGRTDVEPSNPEVQAPPGTTYNFQAEKNDQNKVDTRDFIRTLLPR